MTITEVISIVIAIVGSGGVATIVTAWASRRKNKADASATNIKSILEIDERLTARINKLEIRVATLENENLELKQKEIELNHRNLLYKEEINELKNENELLRKENQNLKEQNKLLKQQIVELQKKPQG